MAGVREHTELTVWKLCNELRERIRPIVDRAAFGRYPKLREQLDEAAESPCPNIGEGFTRYFPRDNARFVRVAAGSLTEVIEHLGRAHARRLITTEESESLVALARRARKAATRYMVYLESAEAPNIERTKPRSTRNSERRSDLSGTLNEPLNGTENQEPRTEPRTKNPERNRERRTENPFAPSASHLFSVPRARLRRATLAAIIILRAHLDEQRNRVGERRDA